MLQNRILSNMASMKYFDQPLNENEIIDVLSDIKHRVFPRPFERLSEIKDKPSLVGVEIGVCGGEHALSLLENLAIEKLYCIDPYDLYEDYDEGKFHYGNDQLNLKDTEEYAKKRLLPYGDKVIWIKKMSENAILDIKEKVDFVYIDGNHDLDFVRRDIENYYPLVKSGGVIGGHDFYNGFQKEHDGVISAVMSWTHKHKLELKVELPDWWINI